MKNRKRTKKTGSRSSSIDDHPFRVRFDTNRRFFSREYDYSTNKRRYVVRLLRNAMLETTLSAARDFFFRDRYRPETDIIP